MKGILLLSLVFTASMLSAGGQPAGQGVFAVSVIRPESQQQMRPEEGIIEGSTPGGGEPTFVLVTRGGQEGESPFTSTISPGERQETVFHSGQPHP